MNKTFMALDRKSCFAVTQ